VTLHFPVIQTCEGGLHTDWIEIAPAGGPEPDHPAPAITLTGANPATTSAPSSATTALSPVTGDRTSNNSTPTILGLAALAIVVAVGATILMRRRS
jgi:hypothetical protein